MVSLCIHTILAKHFPDAAYRLAGSLFIFDQAEAHMIISMLAEAYPRRDRHPGITDQLFTKIQ